MVQLSLLQRGRIRFRSRVIFNSTERNPPDEKRAFEVIFRVILRQITWNRWRFYRANASALTKSSL